MQWSKLKNVIIAVLLVMNLSLLFLVLGEAVAEDGLELEARAMALDFLTERGITVEESKIPREMTLLPQQLIWDRGEELQWANALLGEVKEESLGGEIVRYYNDSGEVRFHGNGEFYGSFVADLWADKSPHEQAEYVMETLGYQGVLWKEEGGTLSYLQTAFQGIFWGCETSFIFSDGSLMEISQGKRLEGTYVQGEKEDSSIATALVQFYHGLGETICSKIYQVEPCYLVTTPLSSSAVLTPCWYFFTDSGDYILEPVAGVLEQVK
ncbi:MAG: hypothetical protein R3Y63_12435 [Eubacteriales bacterium]